MSQVLQDMPTFDHYAFNLRDGLRKAAMTTLSELEGSINNIGYGWLDGYMEQIMDRQNRAPITELMKTPSRTQTVKKTRATTAAAKDRADKVVGLNARLALSPSTKQNNRVALSPLQPRSLNVSALSPIPIASPKASPVTAKSKPEKVKAKPKAKKGKSKKADENDENSPPTSANSSQEQNETSTSTEISKSSKSSKSLKSSKSTKSAQETNEPKSKSSKSKSKKEKEKEQAAEAAEQPMEVEETIETPTPANVPEDPPVKVVVEDKKTQEIEENDETEPAIIVPATQDQLVMEIDAQAPIVTSESAPEIEDQTKEDPPEVMAEMQHQIESEPAPPNPEKTGSGNTQAESERKVDPSMPTSFALPPVTVGAQPIRQVRSSWLSKALGANAIPVNGIPAADNTTALRKSYAASQRPNTAVDFSGLRKSLAPVNGLKRKSDHGMDEEEEDEEVERPEKTIKVDYTDALPARTPASSRPGLPDKTPSFGSAGVASQPSSLDRGAMDKEGRSDIHKVTKALDELREKTAAKELAKQKAALAASTGARVPQAKSTGTGFLRGLGSIGAGLLGLGGSGAEEEAQRLARELEEERLAELELEKLMKEATKPEERAQEKTDEKEMEVYEQPPTGRSTTPEVEAPIRQQPKSPEEEVEEEMFEEQSVLDELLPATERESVARQNHPPAPVKSTTPTNTPTKPAAKNSIRVVQGVEEKRSQEVSVVTKTGKGQIAAAGLGEKTDKDHAKAVKGTRQIKGETMDEDQVMREDATHRKNPSTSSVAPTPLNMSTSSVAPTGSMLGQAHTMAAKALGVKPATAPVKSIQLAAAAAKKEQAAAERKAALKEADAKRAAAATKKAEEDRIRAEEERVRADEERKAKIAEIEEKRRLRAEFEKRQKERAEKIALAVKEKADKEKAERDAQAAKMKAVEEEAARKRKMAAQNAALNKSQNKAQALSSSQLGAGGKGKEPFRPTKQSTATLGSSASHSSLNGMAKMGPSAFRTAIEASATSSSTITLVTQQNGERKALGPPSRPSAMQQQHHQQHQQPIRQSTHHATTLQQSRVALQTQLDEKAAMVQSEDIVLPDIASEYSDSDDEDRTKDFIPPTWAESPQLRAALEAQQSRNPDELFGPIKPLDMEELFKVRTGKFRARTSSANWSKTGDGLTKAEEVEYAKRMGFRALPSNLGGGQ
uniref:Inner centromere protein ARK-binding domain-containing protein n=1 Tax=Kwoniella dejecticola CBS 10117 TaxID=1296121 RepID=A0A1A6A2D3_9TREE|nr:uncharacterized protein I303_05079 [Kwoniella dejecticola CBS 10117]OBR84222.1 hypothetical protein I303_05079 [Kwoniella dejecticola CBS 10117]